MTALPIDQLLPAAGQGALALQCRADNTRVRSLLGSLNDAPTAQAVQLEREVVRLLHGDCHSPIAALATFASTHVTLQAAVAARDGRPPLIHAQTMVPLPDAWRAPHMVVQQLESQGAAKLLHE